MTVAPEPPIVPLASDARIQSTQHKEAKLKAKREAEARDQQAWFDAFYKNIPLFIEQAIKRGKTKTSIEMNKNNFTDDQYSLVKALLLPSGYKVHVKYHNPSGEYWNAYRGYKLHIRFGNKSSRSCAIM